MKSLRLTLLVSCLALWFAPVNSADAAYTYYFTADPTSGQPTAYNGSSITIDGLNIIAWNLFGDLNGGLQSGTGDGSFWADPGSVVTADANTWTGTFTISTFGATSPFGINSFSPLLSYTGTNGSGGGPTSGSLSSNFGGTGPDPIGTWSARPSVPDSGATFVLLGIACGALVLYHRRVKAV